MSLLDLGVHECDNLIFFYISYFCGTMQPVCAESSVKHQSTNQPDACSPCILGCVCVCVCVSDIKNRLMRTSRVPATAWVSRRRWSVPASLRTTYPAIKPTLTSTATLRIRFHICFGCESEMLKMQMMQIFPTPLWDCWFEWQEGQPVCNKLCGRPPQYAPAPAGWPLTIWPWKWYPSHVWRGLPLCQFLVFLGLCSWLRPDVCDRQTNVIRRQTRIISSCPLPYGRSHN